MSRGIINFSAQPLIETPVAPRDFVCKGEGHYFVDFGRAAFGTVELTVRAPDSSREMEVHLGERLANPGTLDLSPLDGIRYRRIPLRLREGTHTYRVVVPPDTRNTERFAIPMPPEIGEVMPFRYCELLGCPSVLNAASIRQITVHYPFDDAAADFESSNATLNSVWELCKYTIKATTFCGLYVDGDRERIPYEGDAFINQLGHYCVDSEYAIARHTHEYLLFHPTWPTEWILFSVLMAWEDYLYTGDNASLVAHYADLDAKTLRGLARDDGLISSCSGLMTETMMDSVHYNREIRDFFGRDIEDIVDWPDAGLGGEGPGERDGYEMVAVNTVVNAFHYRALVLMGRIAASLKKADDAEDYRMLAGRVKQAMHRVCFDQERGIYIDGEGSAHASLHANVFPLAFGLVPPERKQGVVDFIRSRNMACSVYGAQFLLDALYKTGEAQYALELLTATHDRSWYNMLKSGSTMATEAWGHKYKPNQDWNHAWGAAPANLIPRRLMGVRPLSPGFERIRVQPQPGNLDWAHLRTPTPLGPVNVSFENRPDCFLLNVDIPSGATAQVVLPCADASHSRMLIDHVAVSITPHADGLLIEKLPSGHHDIEVRPRE